ncbi:MAG: hypothetical protein ACI4MY_02670 [Christensenellales bacterium]
MFINKKLIVLSGDVSGYVKIEKLSDKCIAKAKIIGASDALLGIFEKDRLVYLGDCDSVANLDDIDVEATITVVAMSNGRIIARGSVNGNPLGQSRILGEIDNRLEAYRGGQKVDTYPQKSQSRQSNDTQERVERKPQKQSQDVVQSRPTERDDEGREHEKSHRQEERIQERLQSDEEGDEQGVEKDCEPSQPTMQWEEMSEEPKQIDQEVETEEPPKKSADFYESIKEELDKLFATYQADEELERLIENSRWVRVPTGDEGFYVTGIVYYDGVPQIICYGVPDKDNSNPPPCNATCRQWLPVADDGRGYWMMYQSAIDGEFVEES